jgi:hypothetical protein
MYVFGFATASLLAAASNADDAAENAWNRQKTTMLVLMVCTVSACTTVNCPPEAEQELRAWALVEVLPAGKGTHSIDVVILQLVMDESELLSAGDTLLVTKAVELLQFQQANVVITYRDRWELETVIN